MRAWKPPGLHGVTPVLPYCYGVENLCSPVSGTGKTMASNQQAHLLFRRGRLTLPLGPCWRVHAVVHRLGLRFSAKACALTLMSHFMGITIIFAASYNICWAKAGHALSFVMRLRTRAWRFFGNHALR